MTLRSHHDYRTGRLPRIAVGGIEGAASTADLRGELIGAEREYIYRMLQDGRITDESRRRIERELDLEEAIIANKCAGPGAAVLRRGRAMPLGCQSRTRKRCNRRRDAPCRASPGFTTAHLPCNRKLTPRALTSKRTGYAWPSP